MKRVDRQEITPELLALLEDLLLSENRDIAERAAMHIIEFHPDGYHVLLDACAHVEEERALYFRRLIADAPSSAPSGESR